MAIILVMEEDGRHGLDSDPGLVELKEGEFCLLDANKRELLSILREWASYEAGF